MGRLHIDMGGDACCFRQAVKRLMASAKSTDKEFREFPGGYHELLKGPEKVEAVQTLIRWIGKHSSTPAEFAGAKL